MTDENKSGEKVYSAFLQGVRERAERQAKKDTWKTNKENPMYTPEQFSDFKKSLRDPNGGEAMILEQENKEKAAAEKANQLKERFKVAAEAISHAETNFTDQDIATISFDVASTFHREWQKTSGYEVRWKPLYRENYSNESERTEDAALEQRLRSARPDLIGEILDKKTGVTTLSIDIQHLAFQDLSSPRREENQDAATFVTEFIADSIQGKRNVSSPQYLEYASDEVHEAWKKRNESWAPAHQLISYDLLSTELKNKDREHVVLAFEGYAKLVAEKKQTAPQGQVAQTV